MRVGGPTGWKEEAWGFKPRIGSRVDGARTMLRRGAFVEVKESWIDLLKVPGT